MDKCKLFIFNRYWSVMWDRSEKTLVMPRSQIKGNYEEVFSSWYSSSQPGPDVLNDNSHLKGVTIICGNSAATLEGCHILMEDDSEYYIEYSNILSEGFGQLLQFNINQIKLQLKKWNMI